MSEQILSVENLGVAFRTPNGVVTGVEDVSFTLNRGEILGIVGESGSGKTVTCRSILGLLPRTAHVNAGRITLEGSDLLTLDPAELEKLRGEKIAMIFQTPATYLDPLMRVGWQIGEVLQIHFGASPQASRQQAIDLLRSVKIIEPERRVDSYPHELSGGMKQRVMIAGALACRPEILIADEPSTGLDVTVQAGILQLLRQLRDEHGLSIIMVSHDLGVIAQMCDWVVVMKDGKVVEQGRKEDILLNPQAEYTRKLIQAHPSIDLQSLRAGEAPVVDQERPLLAVKNLSVTFGRLVLGFGQPPVQAVQDVSFAVMRGETLGIVGESGSGKSTIARCIVRLLKPTEGTVLYNRVSVHDMEGADLLAYRRAVQMVFQDPFMSLNPRMTVAQTIAEPLRTHEIVPPDKVEARILELMDSVELPATLRNRRPHELSGGQSQRVGIARALTMNPEILIADEITSALDVTIQAQILDLLERLRKERTLTILLISHDLGVIQRLSHNVMVMRGGRLVEYGPTHQILAYPHEDYTRQLLDAVPRMPSAEALAR